MTRNLQLFPVNVKPTTKKIPSHSIYGNNACRPDTKKPPENPEASSIYWGKRLYSVSATQYVLDFRFVKVFQVVASNT